MSDDSSTPTFIRLSELRAQNEALKRAKTLRESYGINFYRPHWKQHIFHTNPSIGRYLRTGNRFGKSECGVCESLSWALGGRPWYKEIFDIFDGDKNLRYHHEGHANHPFVRLGIPDHPVKGLILVVDWDKVKEVFTNREGSYDTWGKLWKFFPRNAIGKITNGGRGDRVVKVEIKRPEEYGGGSSTLTFDTVESFKHNRMGVESSDWDFIHVDEPCPEPMFKGHARGLMDRNGSYWFNCTPLDEMWINDLFTPKVDTTGAQKSGILEASDGLGFGTKFIVTGSVYDNPYRNEAGVAEFESTLTREERECRLYGLPLAMAGMVYKEFIYDMHVLADVPRGWLNYHTPPKDYTIRVAWDVHGARLPQAILCLATSPTGDVFVYDELFDQPLITPNARLLKQKLEGYFVCDQLIDPRALIVNPVTESADVLDAIADEGLFFDPASKDLTTGISKVKERLSERHVVTKLPTIYFSPNLKETLYEFTHYIYDMAKNVPKDKDDHMMENLYRLILNGTHYVEPPSDLDFAGRGSSVTLSLGEDRKKFFNSSARITS